MRVVSLLLSLAVILFLLWPNLIPVGFSGAWWGREQIPVPQPDAAALPPSADKAKPGSEGQPVELAATDQGADEKTAALPPAAKTETKLYRRVTVRDGGTLQADGVVIRLAGINARGPDEVCKHEAGKAWPCGAAAKAALAKLIRSRAVTCILPKSGEHNIFFARCSVGGTDLSLWMVRQGWAEPNNASESSLADAFQAAKKERLGLWRSAE
ncbi:MAG TPA: thermonuclease family protein [Methyloceanibacter sp.]|nr:thermonuclease family protein [Methyloceanibacter sp.]